jgi:hypothetical protein
MRRFFTLTLLSALLLTAGNSPSAQQRAAAPVRQEIQGKKADRAAADEDFARANQEVSKLTRRLGTDRKYANRFIAATRAQDRAKTEALLKEAGVRGGLKFDEGSVEAGDRAGNFTITFCYSRTCITITITVTAAG